MDDYSGWQFSIFCLCYFSYLFILKYLAIKQYWLCKNPEKSGIYFGK